MRRMQTWRWVPAAVLLLLAAGGTAGRAEDLAIRSFDATGRLLPSPNYTNGGIGFRAVCR